MRLLLAGLLDRRGMNAAVLLVTLVAVCATVLVPTYGGAAVEHLLDTRLDERAPYTTGLTYTVAARDVADVPAGDPADYDAPSVDSLVKAARAPFEDTPGVRTFWPVETPWALDRGGRFTYGQAAFVAPAYWRAGMCRLVRLEGTCPSGRGEALMQATMARTLGLGTGDTFDVTYTESFLRRTGTTVDGVEDQRRRTVSWRLVGTYTVPDPSSPAWFDLSRFTGPEDLVLPPQGQGPPEGTAPALLVDPSSLDFQSVEAGVDRPIDTTAVDVATTRDAEATARRFRTTASEAAGLVAGSDVEVLPDLDLASVFGQVRSERALLSRVLVAALVPLVVLALLLLFALVSSAAEARRPQVALARLRGQSSRQVLRFAVGEPFLVVLVAAPLGVAVALLTARLLARAWLHPGIPVALDATTLLGLAAVVLAALGASWAAALAVVREPLSVSLAVAVRRRDAGSRSALVLRSAVVAVAVAAVGNLLASGDQSSQLLALLTPTLLALAVAVGGAALLRLLARAWIGRTAASGGTAAFLAARRLGRRRDLANLMVPLLLAVAVLTVAVVTTATSDDWRLSRARSEVGAARTYLAAASPGRLLEVTREVDPRGRYLAAAVLDDVGDDMGRAVFVDTSRLARVAAWDPSWSDVRPPGAARRLSLPEDERISFTGRELTVRVRDVALRSATGAESVLSFQYVDGAGEQHDEVVGRIPNGPGRTLTVRLPGCARRCLVEQLAVTGTSASVSDVDGRLTVASVALDGREVDWGLTRPDAWRPARPFPVSLVDPPVLARARPDGLHLRLFLGHLPPGPGRPDAQVAGIARVTPATTPEVVPALVASGTRTRSAARTGSGIALTYPASTVVGQALNGQQVPMRVVDRVSALPLVGTEGSLSDLETSLVEFEPPAGALVTTELWVAPGTPASVLAAVRDHRVGLSDPRSLDASLRDLRGDAFSLGLRLFLVVGLATLLLAVLGVLASAVLQSRWRSYEVAALRVVGVSQRSLVRGSVLEYVVLLGLAVVLGLAAAEASLRLVLPSLSLGTAGVHEPDPVYAAHWPLLLGVGGGLFVLAVLIALGVSRRVVRMGRPSTLRWAEQG